MLEIEAVLKSLGLSAAFIQPIGNHELKRHWVYTFRANGRDQVIKIYYKERRLEREVEALSVLSHLEIPMAELLDHGHLSDGRPFMILSKLEGDLLSKARLSIEDQTKVYGSMGALLGKMHQVKALTDPTALVAQLNRYAHEAMMAILQSQIPTGDKECLQKAYEVYQSLMLETDYTKANCGFCHNDFDARNVIVNDLEITGVIDFEGSGFGYTENDLLNLHRKVFTESQELEHAFFAQYTKYVPFDSIGYKKRLKVNLLRDVLENCSWAYDQARTYYEENLSYLKQYLL